MSIFTTRGGADPKVMGTVESGSSRWFFWYLAKSDWTYSYGDIKCQEHSRGGGAATGGGGGRGVQYNSKVLIYIDSSNAGMVISINIFSNKFI